MFGDTDVRVGGLSNVYPARRVSMPFTLETVTSAGPAAWAGVMTIRVAEDKNDIEAAGMPSKVTVVETVKSEPAKVKLAPPKGLPLVGEMALIAGGLL